MSRPHVLFEELLDTLLIEESEPSHATLTRWAARYPEHREALANFFATWAVQAELPQDTPIDEERLANLAVSHALDIVHRRREASSRAQKASRAQKPRLATLARAAGISEEQLAARTGLDRSVIAKLGLCRLTDIPRLCFERIATVLGTTAGRIQEVATGPPIPALGVRYKAKQKPTPITEPFADAIRDSSLSADAKRSWLDALATEREGDAE